MLAHCARSQGKPKNQKIKPSWNDFGVGTGSLGSSKSWVGSNSF